MEIQNNENKETANTQEGEEELTPVQLNVANKEVKEKVCEDEKDVDKNIQLTGGNPIRKFHLKKDLDFLM